MLTIVMEPIPVLRFSPRMASGLARAVEPFDRAARRAAACASDSLDLPALAAWLRSAPLAAAGELAVLAIAAVSLLGLWSYL